MKMSYILLMMLFVWGCSNKETISVDPKDELVTHLFGQNPYGQSVLLEIKNEDSHLKLNLKNNISHYFGEVSSSTAYNYTLFPNKYISYGVQKKYSYNSKDSAYIHSGFHNDNHIFPTIQIDNHKYLIKNSTLAIKSNTARINANITANYLGYNIKDSIVFDIEHSSVIFEDDLYYDSIFVIVQDTVIDVVFFKGSSVASSLSFTPASPRITN